MPIPTPDSLSASEPFLSPRSKEPSKGISLVQQFKQGCVLLVCALASYLLISHFCLQSVRVVGTSMVPTLRDSQFYLLNRWVLHFRPPQRSEIVVLRDPLDGGFAVKRVIATAGDSASKISSSCAARVSISSWEITEAIPSIAAFTGRYPAVIFLG
jgi:hypothetical protein